MTTNKKIFALGFFDGVHLGHQALLARCRALAAEHGCTPAAITFDRHPKSLALAKAPDLISTVRDRMLLLQHYGMEDVALIPVVREVMSLPWQEFLQRPELRCAAGFVCGDDFRFGYRGEGTAEKLRTYCLERGIPCIIVSQQAIDDIRISSTYIRRQIEVGDMATAVRFLGHPYTLTGTAVRNPLPGPRLDIPKAGIRFPEGLVIPRLGVYACRVLVEGRWYAAVTNIGQSPDGIRVEPWILDFSGCICGREITLQFLKFLRGEENFSTSEALQGEILRNAEETRTLFQI